MFRSSRLPLPSFAVLALLAATLGCSPSSSSSSSPSSTDGGGPGGEGAGGGGGGVSSGEGGALSATTFLYLERAPSDTHSIVAFDLATRERRLVSDLRGDGSTGWKVSGLSISRDRTRIAIASLYGPTAEDAATKTATNRVWTFAPDGTDFRRLTPVFDNTGQGRSGFQISVQDPAFTKDGADVLYSYGEFWYEGSTLMGGSRVWSVSAGGGVPALFPSQAACSIVNPSINPATGEVLAIHSVCAQGKDGLYLYPPSGGEPRALPEALGLNVMLETPSWAADGSGFLFIALATIQVGGSSRTSRGLFAYDLAGAKASPIVLPEAEDEQVQSAALAPDASALVYCLRKGEAEDLHVIDLTADPPTDTALTTNGASCHPVW